MIVCIALGVTVNSSRSFEAHTITKHGLPSLSLFKLCLFPSVVEARDTDLPSSPPPDLLNCILPNDDIDMLLNAATGEVLSRSVLLKEDEVLSSGESR